jgi:exonuclease III
MFYNVENLFDTNDDPLTDDNAFLPEGLMKWNVTRYRKKINSLYKVISAAGGWDSPAIIGFCEVENRKVLGDLINDTYLSKQNYSIIHEDSPDRRGIDVCLLYRHNLAEIIYYKYWVPTDINRNDFNSRSVLYTKLLLNSDTLHLILNHWPSRRGGVLAGEDFRIRIADMIRYKTDSILKSDHQGAKIIIMGDFNCNPDDEVIKSLICSSDSAKAMINLSESLYEHGLGTYRYMGTWEMIDQVIVSHSLTSGKAGIHTETKSLKIFNSDFLLKKDPKYPGTSPFSTYRGYKYQGGYSDHLPVLLDLTW